MDILGINGSPRIGGNTDILLDRVLEGARKAGADVEKVVLNNLKFSPCLECDNLRDDGSCIIEDDMQSLYKKIEVIDALILASPVFFGTLSAHMKMMIDRFQCAWRSKHLLEKDLFRKRKIGAFISVAASDRRDFFNNSKMVVKNLFVTINVEYKEELFCPGCHAKSAILGHPDCLQKAYELGQRFAKMEVI
jgi:multimeric flavodoxin WrbA